MREKTPSPKEPKRLVSKIKPWCDKRNMTRDDWLALCLQSRRNIKAKPFSIDTFTRAYNGDCQLGLRTVQIMAIIMQVESIADVIDFE